ncbi:MAG: LamG-like jellyroll fold domain-containing protein [Candidatus Thiodiazotropha endolucinida]
MIIINDDLYGEDDDDYILGNAGNDDLYGGNGRDTIDGGADNDTISGGNHEDTIYGGLGDDYIDGDSGRDYIDGGEGNDTIYGGTYGDTVYGGIGNDYISAQTGHDTVYGGDGDDTIYGGDDNDYIDAGNGHDTVFGGDWNDTIYGGAGNDDIKPGSGHDTVYGGDGDDYIHQSVDAWTHDDNKFIYGEAGNDTISMADSDDHIYGGADNDTISGNQGDDSIFGGSGDDTYIFNIGDGLDVINDESGLLDKIQFGSGISLSDIRLNASGLYDLEITFINSPGDKITILGQLDGTGTQQIEKLVFDDATEFDLLNNYQAGQTGDDVLSGTIDIDYLDGVGGNDTINALAGNDILVGGAGDDTLSGGAGDDVLDGEDGSDTADYGSDISAVSVDLSTSTATDGNGDTDTLYNIENITGSAYGDILIGDLETNILVGGAGNDVLTAEGAAYPSLSPSILTNSPVAYWVLDDLSGNNAINQGTLGSAVDGTYKNGILLGQTALYAGGTASAAFDGVNDYVAVPDSTSINRMTVTERTIELVFNADTVSGRQVLYEEGGYKNALVIYIDNGDLYVNGRDKGDWGAFNFNTAVNEGQTYHVALVVDYPGEGDLRGYLDGVEFGSGVITKGLASHSANIGIGAMNDDTYFHDGSATGNGYYFDGRISDVAIYNSVLTDTEISDHADIVLGISPFNGDILKGGDGDDALHGGAGDDTLYGEDGLDTLAGGLGADRFVFESASAFNDVDVIDDFSVADNDAIDISDLLSAYDPLADAITDFVRITDDGIDSTLAVDADGGADNFVAVATLTGVTGLTDEAALETSGHLIAA